MRGLLASAIGLSPRLAAVSQVIGRCPAGQPPAGSSKAPWTRATKYQRHESMLTRTAAV
jgi:hypothetical protein